MKKFLLGLSILVLLSAAVHAGDAFVKAGLVVRPKNDLPASDRYLIDFGSDYRIGNMIGLGWEVATAYYSQDFAGDTLRTAPINAWVNLKVSTPTEGIRPFGKVGFGALTNVVNFKSNTDSSTAAGIHFSGGIEAAHFVAELQGQKRFKNDSDFTIILLGGFTW